MITVAKNRAQIGANGRLVIPAEIRRQLGLEAGEELAVHLDGTQVILERPEDLLARIQADWQAAAEGKSMVDELIAERRLEAAREEKELRQWMKSRSSTRRR